MYSAGLALVAATVIAAHLAMRPPEPPSIVLITVDSLRADHLGIYGYDRPTSPNIDALASEGAVFDRAFTTETLSGPAHASIFTSLYPVTHGALENGLELDEEAWTLAEMLHGAGYRTAAIVGDWIVSDMMGFDQGFERFERMQVRTSAAGSRRLAEEARTYRLALNWLRGMRGERFFLWLHCQHPHFSYDPLPPYDRMFDEAIAEDWPYREFGTMKRALEQGRLTAEDERGVVALYDGEIAFTDAMLGPIFEELRGHPEPLVVLLTADHGDLLFEPEASRIVGHGAGHFYEGAMRVPLIVWPAPGGGRRVEALASAIDLLPTVVDFAGLEPPALAEGLSLRPWIEDGGDEEQREAVYAMYLRHDEQPTLAMRTRTHKLILRGQPEPGVELYDLKDDPGENRDLSSERPALAQSMTAELSAWFEARPDRLPGARRGLTPEIEALLRRGGYLDDDEGEDDR